MGRATGLLCALAAALASGCETYQLRGRVATGDATYITLVDADDPRLQTGDAIAGVVLRLQTDPGKLNRAFVGQGVTNGQGEFEIPVDEVGAGFLEYDVGIDARRPGFESAESFFRLPPSGKRVLVVLRPGKPTRGTLDDESLLKQYDDFRR